MTGRQRHKDFSMFLPAALNHATRLWLAGSGIVLKWTLATTPSRASPKESPAEPPHEEIEANSYFIMNLDVFLIARGQFDN